MHGTTVKIMCFCNSELLKENHVKGQDEKLLCAVHSKNEICIKSVWHDSNVPGDFKKGEKMCFVYKMYIYASSVITIIVSF